MYLKEILEINHKTIRRIIVHKNYITGEVIESKLIIVKLVPPYFC